MRVAKLGDKYTLQCGHRGTVIWMNAEGDTIAVREARRSCSGCGKGAKTSWTPNVFLIQLEPNATR
jgi:hypothetical protein